MSNLFKKKKKLKDRHLDFEDVLVEVQENMPFESQDRIPLPVKNILVYLPFILISIFFLVVIGRIIFLQVKGADYYRTLAEKNRSQIEWVRPHRGIIYDRNKVQLVYNVPLYNLIIENNILDQDIEKTYNFLSELINISKEDLLKKIQDFQEKSFNEEIVLKKNLTDQQVFKFKSQKDKWPFLALKIYETRDYLNDEAFAHLLGYTGRITQLELKQEGSSYLLDDIIGKAGLEKQYEKILRGQLGIKNVEVSPIREEIRPLSQREASDGLNILTTIDANLQQKIFTVLKDTLEKKDLSAAAAVALNPSNGDVLAMVSLPSFNNSNLAQGVGQKEFQGLINAEERPFFNRVIKGIYPPGSTFKPLVALAALEEGIVNPQTYFTCKGFLRIVNQYNPNVSYLFRDWKTHGRVNLIKAIAQSCNVYFYIIGGGYEDFEGLGIDKIKAYVNKIFLNKLTGIDLPDEAMGLIPDPQWKKQAKNEAWYIGDTYHASIGQGDISLTPLQIAQIYSFFANKGILYQPRLLLGAQEVDQGKFNFLKPEIITQSNFQEENIDLVRRGLREAVLSGSAQILQRLSITAAAKTGTAQIGDGSESHAWFATFAPYENPEIVLVVLIEKGGGGSAIAAPAAYDILNWYFSEKKEADVF